ncbi:hypothetical protein GGQ05_000827 [Salinibacter ruber]|nr:hypothetical protein [Salinibacter ruber]
MPTPTFIDGQEYVLIGRGSNGRNLISKLSSDRPEREVVFDSEFSDHSENSLPSSFRPLECTHPHRRPAEPAVPVVVAGSHDDLHLSGGAVEYVCDGSKPVGVGVRQGVVQEHRVRRFTGNEARHRQADEHAELLLRSGAELIKLEASV